jgi:hypothetical protein
MNSKDYIELRNHLQALACMVNIYSKEYANLKKRIHIVHEKAYGNNLSGASRSAM